MSKLDLEKSMEDFRTTVERTGTAARWDETVIDWIEKGQAVYRDIMKEIVNAVDKAEAREAEEARVRLMETNRDKLVDLADKVEGRAAEEAESNLLIELGEEIEYNVVSIARMLKGHIHEEFKDESVEAARVGQRKLDAFRARLELLLSPTDNFQRLYPHDGCQQITFSA